MDGSHPKNADPRPKRRKDKDNPYEIITVGINTASPRYYLSFTDGSQVKRCVEIDKALFDAFDCFELDDLSFMNEVDNHYERSEQTEASLHRKAAVPQKSVEETAFQHIEEEALHRAIAKLPNIQRRRLILHYFRGLTYQQIAKIEGCKHPAVMKSVKAAIANLQKILEG